MVSIDLKDAYFSSANFFSRTENTSEISGGV